MTGDCLGTLEDIQNNKSEYLYYTFEDTRLNSKSFGFFSLIQGYKFGEETLRTFNYVAASDLNLIRSSNSGNYRLGRFIIPVLNPNNYLGLESPRKQVKYSDFNFSAEAFPIVIDDSDTRFIYLHITPSSAPIDLIIVTYQQSDYSKSFPISTPSYSNYFFEGFYTAQNVQVINAKGELNANVSGVTDSNKKWIASDRVTHLYAKFSQTKCTINLSSLKGSGYTTSINVVGGTNNYDKNPVVLPTGNSTKGFTFKGYYTNIEGSIYGEGIRIIDKNGYIINQAGGDNTYTNENGEWVYKPVNDFVGITLYAHWDDNRGYIDYWSFDYEQKTINLDHAYNYNYGTSNNPIHLLSNIYMGDSLDGSFPHCRLYFDGDPVLIPDKMFKGKYNLFRIILPESITKIGNQAFLDCYKDTPGQYGELTGRGIGLESVQSYGVTFIGTSAFSGCSNLEEMIITLPNDKILLSFLTIGQNAFYKAFSVLNVGEYGTNIFSYNGLVSEIGQGAFKESWIEKVNFSYPANPLGITMNIRYRAFNRCERLKEIGGLQFVDRIEEEAFRSCPSLLTFTGFEKSNRIDFAAFANTPGSNVITLKKDIILDRSVFYANRITEIIFLGTKAEFTARNWNAAQLHMDKPFYGCSNLLKITCSDGELSGSIITDLIW